MSLDDLISAARHGGDASTAADRDRVRARLAVALAGGATVTPIARARARRLPWKILLVAALLGVGTASAFETRRAIAERAHEEELLRTSAQLAELEGPSRIAAARAAAIASASIAVAGDAPDGPAPAVAAKIDRATTASSPIAPAPSPIAPAPSSTTLAEEIALVQAARAALRRGASAQALAELDRYDATYRRGTFGQEVAALRIFALCDAGRVAEARVRGAAYLRAWPRSPLAARIQTSCARP